LPNSSLSPSVLNLVRLQNSSVAAPALKRVPLQNSSVAAPVLKLFFAKLVRFCFCQCLSGR
jgi:hypothetical protein